MSGREGKKIRLGRTEELAYLQATAACSTSILGKLGDQNIYSIKNVIIVGGTMPIFGTCNTFFYSFLDSLCLAGGQHFP